MAYTNVWRTTVPSVIVKTDQLDNHIRRLRLEIQERMTQGDVTWTTDPVIGTTLTRYHHMHWSMFKYHDTNMGAKTNLTLTNAGLSSNAVQTFTISAPIILPRGSIIVDLHLSCAVGVNGSIPWSLKYVNTAAGPGETVISSGTVAAGTAQGNQALAAAINHTIDATDTNYRYYLLSLVFTQTGAANGPVIQGARIKYTASANSMRV